MGKKIKTREFAGQPFETVKELKCVVCGKAISASIGGGIPPVCSEEHRHEYEQKERQGG